ncbi:hypothetical protein DFS34DRAFT_128193 [Phlyctochytrium arcticum]|nr:hypothetical protein DFS34DRAFT_128193 [Phlyctochytrium arcticum]
MPETQIAAFIADILRFGLERLSLVPADKRSFEVQEAIAAQELAVDVLASMKASDTLSTAGPGTTNTDLVQRILDSKSISEASKSAQESSHAMLAVDASTRKCMPAGDVGSTASIQGALGGNATKEKGRELAKFKFPAEVLFNILQSADEAELYQCSLVSRHWSAVAEEVLWRRVSLDTAPRLRRFVRAVACSTAPRNGPDGTAMRPRPSLAVAKHLGDFPKAFEDFSDFIGPGLRNIASGATRRLGTVVGTRPSSAAAAEEPSIPNSEKTTNVACTVGQSPGTASFDRRDGLGSLVRKLSVPSGEQKVILLQHVNGFLPNLKSLHFRHREYGNCGPLDARILTSLEPLIGRVTSLTIEGVDSPCWPDVCRILCEHGKQIRSLNIEALPEIDAFQSDSDMADVFAFMPRLEFLRLDGIPVGPNLSIENLVSNCPNLRAVALDYCLDVSMEILFILWRNCPQLEFLGLAGVVGSLTTTVALKEHTSLEMLRLVDCDVSDAMIEEIATKAVNLKSLKVAFEDDGCEGIVTVSNELTDRSLHALAYHSSTLQTLAITCCPNMSAKALAAVLERNPITVLDVHRDPGCPIGGFDDTFLKTLAPAMSKIRTLDLYGQVDITEAGLEDALKQGSLKNLRSLSLKSLAVGPAVLDWVRETCPYLESISLVDCDWISADAIRGFVVGIPVAGFAHYCCPQHSPSDSQDPILPDALCGTVRHIPRTGNLDSVDPPPSTTETTMVADICSRPSTVVPITISPSYIPDSTALSTSFTQLPRTPSTPTTPTFITPTASFSPIPIPSPSSFTPSPEIPPVAMVDPAATSDSFIRTPLSTVKQPTQPPSAISSISRLLTPKLSRLRRIYTLNPALDEQDPGGMAVLRCRDSWSIDEGLDILTPWVDAVNRHNRWGI